MIHSPMVHISNALTTYNRAKVFRRLWIVYWHRHMEISNSLSATIVHRIRQKRCTGSTFEKIRTVKYYRNEGNLKRPGNLSADNLKQAVLLQCSHGLYFFSTSSRTCAAVSLPGVVAMCLHRAHSAGCC